MAKMAKMVAMFLFEAKGEIIFLPARNANNEVRLSAMIMFIQIFNL